MENMLGNVSPVVLSRLEGPLRSFGEKLAGDNVVEWEEAFKRFLRKEMPWPCPVCDPFRETGELTLQIPAMPRPTLEQLKLKWSWIESIERDTSPTEAVTLKLATVLREGERSINGAKYEERIAPKLDIILGYQQAVWLVENQDKHPEFMALLGKVYIDFSGLLVMSSVGGRRCPGLSQGGVRWYLVWAWVDVGFDSYGRIAFSSK